LSAKVALDRFAVGLHETTVSLVKKRFWTLLRETIAIQGSDSARRQALVWAAANEVVRLSEPSPRIELNGHAASSLLRAIADAGNVDPPALEGAEGRGPDNSLIAISPFVSHEALFAFAYKKAGEETTFVHGYFYRNARELLHSLASSYGAESLCYQQMSKFVALVDNATHDRPLPPLADAILARLRLSPVG
jgi:hypothetical protein